MIKYDYTNLLSECVGDENGISIEEVEELQEDTNRIHSMLEMRRKNAEIGFYDLPYQKEVIDEINTVASEVRNDFENFVVIGMGGSVLGAIALHSALSNLYHNHIDCAARSKCPRMFYIDNIDPEGIGQLLEMIDIKKTCFNVVTKSGDTAETLACFAIVYDIIKKQLGESAISKHFIATTDPGQRLLRKIATSHNIKTLDSPQNVGGRFSVLSPVGLFPAAVEGIDIKGLLAGAADMDTKTKNPDLFQNPAYLNSVFHYLLNKRKGKSISVMMPYSNALHDFSDWYLQLWAESLGKRFTVDGLHVEVGQTPVKALGVSDQHSQIQLYIEGPNDKIITLIAVKEFRSKVYIPAIGNGFTECDYLENHELGKIMNIELSSTEHALTNNHRPNCKIIFEEINPYNMGQLIYMFEVQTAFSGGLYNINPFNQPGVEEGKISTYALMGRKGFENKKPVTVHKRRII